MAIRFSENFFSYNNTEYRIEIWDKNWSGASSLFSIDGGGPVISYDTDGDKKYNSIITSKLTFDFLVEDAQDAIFINQLRNTYNEKDVYIIVYDPTQVRPIWAGFLLLDLGAEEDMSRPYSVKLTAVDGLSSLKSYDFVPDNSDISPYIESETYESQGYSTFVYWLKEILGKASIAKTTDGASLDYEIATSVNWYNSEHQGTGETFDPLNLTQAAPSSFYKKLDDDNSNVSKWEAMDSYEVLESICRNWGMRCVYWNHTIYFIQISEYQNSESGTIAIPDNITTRFYDDEGVLDRVGPSLGTSPHVLYDLEFEDAIDLGLQKLSGANYDFYPIIDKTTTNFLSVLNADYFQSFPLLYNDGVHPGTTGDFYTTSLLNNMTNAHNFDNLKLQIMLRFINIGTGAPTMEMNWTIRAKPISSGTWTKMLDVDANGDLEWVAFSAPTGSNSKLVFNSSISTPILSTVNVNIMDNEIGGGIIPVDPAFSGTWKFEFYTHVHLPNISQWKGHGTVDFGNFGNNPVHVPPVSQPFGPSVVDVDCIYENIAVSNGQLASFVSPISNGVVGANYYNIQLSTGVVNTYIYKIEDLLFGDVEITTPGALLVYNGTSFVPTEPTGEWGVGTTSGGETITILLCKEVVNNNAKHNHKLGTTSVLSVTNKLKTDASGSALKMVNPIGRLKDKDGTPFVFLRGEFNLLTDECAGEWFEMDYQTTSTSTTTTNSGGLNSGSVGSSAPAGASISAMVAPNNGYNPNTLQNFTVSTSLVRQSASPITSLPVLTPGDSVFKLGDVLQIYDQQKQKRHPITLTQDFTTEDSTINFQSITLDSDISNGSVITFDSYDLGEQYQRKSKGTVAGFEVDATSLEKGGISIDGFLDSDTMTGASDTTLPTSESVKEYVDSNANQKNYSSFGCTTTTTSSTTAGEANAVVIPFDSVIIKSATTTIINFGASGKPGVGNSAYSFSTDGGDFEISWTIGTNTNLVNNRILSGVKLQSGTESGGSIVWADLNPTDNFIYDRGNGSIRKGSASGIMLVSPGASPIVYYRFMLWKEESSNAGTNAITLINSCQVIMKQIN